MDKYIGKKLEGRYEIQELIGMGGMANVYKAYDSIEDRPVAVKILRDEFVGNTEFLRRFKNESKAIAVLSHPNIVRVYDVSFTGRAHSIIMEYIDGITLKDYIERQSVLTWKEAVHFTLQILRAIQHAHDKGIVHRDIKPQNIMLLQNGTIKVTDFGIARFARSEVQTITDRAIGSVHYISPEQAMGDSTDEKADIYSVGVMLFEMLTGRLPFEADSAVSVALKQIQLQAVRPTSINPEIPPGLEEITLRAMQKDAAKRYGSAAEMIADIEEFKKNPTIHFEYKYAGESDRAKNKKIRRAIDKTREEDHMQARRKTPYIPILTGVTLAFTMAALAFIGLMLYYNNPFVQVEEDELPNLVGIKFDTAVASNEKFEIVQDEMVYSDEWAKGVIIEQKPKAGIFIKVGSQVKVTVSRGQLQVQMPNFSGKEARQAVSWLKDNGLEYKEKKEYNSEIPIGCVIYTDPSKDSTVNSGTVVNVYVSMGPERLPVTLIDVTGLKSDIAATQLQAQGLLTSVTERYSNTTPGVVIAQEPPAGMPVDPGSTVILIVSSGRDPNVVDAEKAAKKSTARLRVELPDVDREILIRARIDGSVVAEDTINPAKHSSRYWTARISSEEYGDVLVKVYVDKKLYQDVVLYFEPPAPSVPDNDDFIDDLE